MKARTISKISNYFNMLNYLFLPRDPDQIEIENEYGNVKTLSRGTGIDEVVVANDLYKT